MEIVVALSCILLVLWLIRRWQRLKFFRRLGVPGPKPNLLFGNLLELYTKGPVECHQEWVKTYGRVLGYYYGMVPMLLITDSHLVKNIFIKDFQKFTDREPFIPLVRYDPHDTVYQGLLSLPGQPWKNIRNVLSPTFTAAKMKHMAGSMTDSIRDLIELMRRDAGKEIDAYEWYQQLTMDVITKTAFGVKTDVLGNPDSDLLKSCKIFFDMPYADPFIFVGQCFPSLRRLCLKLQDISMAVRNRGKIPTKMVREELKTVLAHRRHNAQPQKVDLLQLMLDSRIAAGEVDVANLEAGNVEAERKLDEGVVAGKDYRSMNESEIISSALAVLFAGYETTSVALSCTTYLLAKHQDVQEELFDEIQQFISSGQKLEYGAVQKLSLLDKVINESLRLYPSVHLLCVRFAAENVRYGELLIPKGTLVQAPVYTMHHDPEFFADPEKFDVDRHGVKQNMDGITYSPFGVGPRNCLGMRYAQLQLKLAIAHIVCKFRIHLGEQNKTSLPITSRIRTLVPTNGVYIRVEERTTSD